MLLYWFHKLGSMVQHVDESSPFHSNACRCRCAPNSHGPRQIMPPPSASSSSSFRKGKRQPARRCLFLLLPSTGARPRILSIPTRGMDTDQAPGRPAVALHQPQQHVAAAAAVGAAPPSSPAGTDCGSPRYSNDTTLLEGTNPTHERAMSLCFVRIVLLVLGTFFPCEEPSHSLVVRFFCVC
jgi:hypothetical protein